jgi:tight adherence protein C
MNATLILFAIIVASCVCAAGFYAVLRFKYIPDAALKVQEKAIQKEKQREQKAANRGDTTKKLSAIVSHLLPMAKDKESSLHKRLMRAGVSLSSSEFYAISIIVFMFGLLVASFILLFIPSVVLPTRLFVLLVGGFVGYLAPKYYLFTVGKRRKELIDAQLPSTLELLSICVEAGQTIEHGFKTISKRMDGPLPVEFGLVDTEISYFGYKSDEALLRMAKRCNVPSVDLFVATTVQAIRQGTSIGRILKSQAKIARDRREQEIEERANKIPTKMIIPEVLFILPSLFIIAIGPAGISIMTQLPSLIKS